MQERRLGKFYASEDFVKSDEMFPVLKALEFIPWHVEFLLHRGEVEFIGYSPLFEICELGQVIPTYRMKITKSEDGALAVEAIIEK